MKVVVCGAGIAGLAMAHRLAAYGAEVVLVERSPAPRTQGYMIDFFGPGYDAAEAMGLLPALEQVGYRLDEARFVDSHGRVRARLNPAVFAESDRLVSVMRPDLERVLREHLPPEVESRYGTGLVAATDTGQRVRVTLEDGTGIDADLLVGADGVHSTVRRLVFGPERRYLRYLGMHTAAYIFDAPRIHAAVGDRAHLTDSIDRQMGFYGLRDGRVATFAVRRTPDETLPTDPRAAIRADYHDLGWLVPEALAQCPPSERIYYDQVAQIVMPRWSSGRVVLLGDACYAVSLLAGQGASLAVAGAYVLASQLFRDQPVERALPEYERLWRPIVEQRQRVGRASARWFLPASRSQLWLRRVALAVAGLPPVSRLLAALLIGESTSLIRDLAAHDRSTATRPR